MEKGLPQIRRRGDPEWQDPLPRRLAVHELENQALADKIHESRPEEPP